MLEHIEHGHGHHHGTQHDNGAGDPTEPQTFLLRSIRVAIRHINVAHNQRRTNEHVAIHTAHQRSQQTGQHQAHQPDPQRTEEFPGRHAPGHIRISDQRRIIAVQSQHNQSGNHPTNGAEAFDEVAGHQANAGIVFALGRATASDDEVRREHNTDHVHDDNSDDGIERKFTSGTAAHNLKGGGR